MKTYSVIVYKDSRGFNYDEFEVEADSIEEAEIKALEHVGWTDVGELCIEEITE